METSLHLDANSSIVLFEKHSCREEITSTNSLKNVPVPHPEVVNGSISENEHLRRSFSLLRSR